MTADTDVSVPLVEVERQGSTLYEGIKSTLEPAYINRFVAIHIETGDYTVAGSTAEAMRAIRKRHEHGPLFLRKIGPEPEYGLAARLLAGEMLVSERRK